MATPAASRCCGVKENCLLSGSSIKYDDELVLYENFCSIDNLPDMTNENVEIAETISLVESGRSETARSSIMLPMDNDCNRLQADCGATLTSVDADLSPSRKQVLPDVERWYTSNADPNYIPIVSFCLRYNHEIIN